MQNYRICLKKRKHNTKYTNFYFSNHYLLLTILNVMLHSLNTECSKLIRPPTLAGKLSTNFSLFTIRVVFSIDFTGPNTLETSSCCSTLPFSNSSIALPFSEYFDSPFRLVFSRCWNRFFN